MHSNERRVMKGWWQLVVDSLVQYVGKKMPDILDHYDFICIQIAIAFNIYCILCKGLGK